MFPHLFKKTKQKQNENVNIQINKTTWNDDPDFC